MKKKMAIILPLLVLLLLSLIHITSASIQQFSWINAMVGEDPYYDDTVVAYIAGTWWNISISVYNDYLTPPPPPRVNLPINITAIKVYFDWGEWYNATFSPHVRMEPLEVRVFTIGNVTPPTTEAPETWMHSYAVYVEYIPDGSVTPSIDWYISGDNFAVMSAEHFTAFQLYNKLGWMISSGMPIEFVNVTEAQVLMTKAFMELILGEQAYISGIFSNASIYLQNADSYFNSALTAWNEQGTAFENAQLEYYNSLSNASYIQATAALNNSYGWIFFGLGWTLIGIGIIVYGARRPKSTTPSS
ncbi:hypothetical protein HXY33_07910 [Candidatus Bathyarchaeota archaeon]|nr:hypothetical protein [Candidatus Bathyarchaeota archaeon]